MTVSRRKFDVSIKSLVHFDYPYYGESGDGGRDEINGNIFSLKNAKLVGSEKKAASIVSGTPKFGYRCLCTTGNTQYMTASSTEIFNLESGTYYEFECFIMPIASTAGNIITLLNGSTEALIISKNTDNKIIFTSSELSLNVTSSASVSINAWTHIKCILSDKAYIYINGVLSDTGIYTFKDSKDMAMTEFRLGGINGYLDEFIMKNAESSNTVPSSPYQGITDMSYLGGFGDGSAGDVTISADTKINSNAIVSSVSGLKITLSNIQTSTYSGFSTGAEVMFHVTSKRSSSESELGYYAFRKIIAVSGNVITIDKAVSEEFNLASCIKKYYVQAISVPNFKTLTLNKGRYIKTTSFTGSKAGGIIAMRISGNATINGYIYTSAYGMNRTDKLTVTHSDMINRFLVGTGGGIFITCGGTFTASSTARIGGTVDGSRKGGSMHSENGHTYTPYDGGAGYGGKGGITDGENGFVGWGGTSSKNRAGGRPGFDGSCEDSTYTAIGRAGACLILIANKLSCDAAAISTGGQSPSSTSTDDGKNGGGGTGFAYIACKEMI